MIGSAGRGGAGLARAAFPREFPSGGGRGAFALGAAGVLPARGRRALRRGRRREERGKRPRESVSLRIRLRAEAATVAGRRGEGEKRLRGGGGGGGGTPRHFAAEVGSGARWPGAREGGCRGRAGSGLPGDIAARGGWRREGRKVAGGGQRGGWWCPLFPEPHGSPPRRRDGLRLAAAGGVRGVALKFSPRSRFLAPGCDGEVGVSGKTPISARDGAGGALAGGCARPVRGCVRALLPSACVCVYE